MQITYDEHKRERTLAERGLDFSRADEVFAGITFTFPDVRSDYGEDRYITAGVLEERLVVLVWTPRGATRRIISMRKANEREIQEFTRRLG